MNREPNSIRFWRLNAIEALHMEIEGYPLFGDVTRYAFRNELARLNQIEAAVLERAQRIKTKGETK